jgi:MoaA/NifB/PqqE/SkfB family radical SAM enzyme
MPQRLNLAIGRTCFVRCPGCYQFFGTHAPRLEDFVAIAAEFARLGTRRVTVSGGDPLTIPDLEPFIARLRAAGMIDVKVDTVGSPLLDDASRLAALLDAVDTLALPLDGWSDASAARFRQGRPALFTETVRLLRSVSRVRLVVNTVLHRENVGGARAIAHVLASLPSVTHWNVLQYTPTDRVSPAINERFTISDGEFLAARDSIGALPFTADFRTIAERLGDYLLINSDGDAWLPDEYGRTIPLGRAHGRVREVVCRWSEEVSALQEAVA